MALLRRIALVLMDIGVRIRCGEVPAVCINRKTRCLCVDEQAQKRQLDEMYSSLSRHGETHAS